MMRYAMMLILAVATLGLTACETIKGAGRDIQNAGEAIDRKI